MPQSNAQIQEFDLRGDMRNYYRHSIVTFVQSDKEGNTVRRAAYVEDFGGPQESMMCHARLLLPDAGDWGSLRSIPVDQIEFTMPALGMVKMGPYWFHLSRQPARRMRKGYNSETIQAMALTGRKYQHGCNPADLEVVRQIWYGNPDRISSNIVVWDRDIYYGIDKVASLDEEGNVSFIPNKEKLGEFVCKALANNWELATSKYSVRTLPSSQTTPLV